jgi:hypothetical protein
VKLYLIILVTIIICSCSKKESTVLNHYSELKTKQEQQWRLNKDADVYKNFFYEWLDFNNQTDLDDKRTCDVISKDDQSLVLVQDAEGIIIDVAYDKENEETKCFKTVFLGKKYPVPPYAPFYHYMLIRN